MLVGKVPEELAMPLTLRWGELAFTLAGGPSFLMSSTEVGPGCSITGSVDVALASSSVMSKWTALSCALAPLDSSRMFGTNNSSSVPVGGGGASSCCERRSAVSGNHGVVASIGSSGGVM